VAKLNCLVGIHQTTHTVFDAKDVVVDGVDGISKRCIIGNKSRGIKSTEVEGPGWLEFRRIETEWNQCNVTVSTATD